MAAFVTFFKIVSYNIKAYFNIKEIFTALQVLSFIHTKNLKCEVMFTAAYLESSQISVIKFFAKLVNG